MTVTLLHVTPLEIADRAIGKCWDKGCYTGQKSIDRMKRVALKNKHESVIEHIVFSFDIDGLSRAALQELARHRIASLSVKSTRYTLKELAKEEPFIQGRKIDTLRAAKYVVLQNDEMIDYQIIHALDKLRMLVQLNLSNDKTKYALPEAYKTSLVWTINARALRNFLILRSSKAALPEMQKLAMEIIEVIPKEYKFLFEEV